MHWRHPAIAAAAVCVAALLGQPVLQQAASQRPPNAANVGDAPIIDRPSGRAQPTKDLPADFIDSRPIFAHFNGRPVPDTVRGLIAELQRANTCGKDSKVRPGEACALVFYRLDSAFKPDQFRPPLVMRAVYRMNLAADPADTVILMPDDKGELVRLTKENLFEPLRDIRANICAQDKRMPDQCRATDSQGVLYHPLGILGRLENDQENILPPKSAKKHFALYLKAADSEWLKQLQMQDLCSQRSPEYPYDYIMIC